MKRVLLLKAGDVATSVKLTAGDYDRWFVQSIGPAGHRFELVAAHRGQRVPSRPRDYDAVIMTGSPLSVTSPQPWMAGAGDFLLEAAAKKVPVLGVCFGLQLIAQRLGVQVARNPHGREIGTVQVTLTPEGRSDPLFEGLPPLLTVQTTHEDRVEVAPSGAILLAVNSFCRVQAFAWGTYLRAVQFHPELSVSSMSAVLDARAEGLEVEALARGWPPGERVRALKAGLHPSTHGARLLRNFLQRFERG